MESKKRKYTRRKLNPKRITFRRLYQSRAFSIQAICDKLNIGRNTAHNWIRVDFPEGATWRWNEFVKLYEKKVYTPGEIAIALGCTRPSVLRFIVRYKKMLESLEDQAESTSKNAL